MNVLILGLGAIADKHITALMQIDKEIQLFALRSTHPASTHPNVKNLYSADDLNRYDFDFAIISSPTAIHKESINALKAFNSPLFIEKPLSHTLEISEVVNEIVECKRKTYIACNLRFLESLEFVKKMIQTDDKRINEVNIYCGSYLPEWRKQSDFRKIYSAIPELGGGVHLDLIHELDYLYWMFGMPNHVKRTFSKKSTLDLEAFDYANYCIEYPSFYANVVLNYYRRDTKRTFEIVFEDRTIEVDLLKNRVISNGEILFSSTQLVLDTYKAQMNYFIQNTVINNQNSFNTIEDAYHVLQICLEK